MKLSESNITFSETGTYFACVSQYGTEIWKNSFNSKEYFTEVYDEYRILEGADGTHVDFSSNEDYILLADGNGTERVRIWNLNT